MREAAVSFFGAFPAAVLCMPLLGVLLASTNDYIAEGKTADLILLLWCVFGLIGTVALFVSIRGRPKLWTMIGLVLGITSVVGSGGLSFSSGIWQWLFLAPTITAVALILEGVFGTDDEVDDFYG